MSIFGSNPPADDQASDLSRQLNDVSDALDDAKMRQAEAERRVAAMVVARDPAKMDELALKFAADVEDFFARGWEGGAAQRRAVIQVAARTLIENALAGGKPSLV